MNTESKVEELPIGTIFTKVKFCKSEETGATVGFVSQNPITKRVCGVHADSPYPKKICLVDKKLAPDILLNVLYDVTLIPMKEKNGYVAISATPVRFKATVEVTYVPKALYKVVVRFGNKTIVFDPKDGKKDTCRNMDKCLELLEHRVDVEDLASVVSDFADSCNVLLRFYAKDGFVYNAG